MEKDEVIRKLEEILICCERYESFEVKEDDTFALALAIEELKCTDNEVFNNSLVSELKKQISILVSIQEKYTELKKREDIISLLQLSEIINYHIYLIHKIKIESALSCE